MTGRAVATCLSGSPPTRVISEGPIDGPFSALAGMPMSDATTAVDSPRLGADGDLMFVPTLDLSSFVTTIQVYQRDANGLWLRGNDFQIPGVIDISEATHGPEHHVVYATDSVAPLAEASDASGTWQTVATFSLSSLQVPSVVAIWLSPDGLRMVVVANVLSSTGSYLAYTDRDALGQSFRPAVRLDAPVANDPFITADCSRLYFSGLESIFYANQK